MNNLALLVKGYLESAGFKIIEEHKDYVVADRLVFAEDRDTRIVWTIPKDQMSQYEALLRASVSKLRLKRGGPHRLDHLAAFLRWTPQLLLPPVREILRGGEPEGKVPLRMFFQASVHLLRRRPSVRRVRSLAVV